MEWVLISELIKQETKYCGHGRKGQTEIVMSEDRQNHGQQNETKDKHTTHNTTLKIKAEVTLPPKKHSSHTCSTGMSSLNSEVDNKLDNLSA